VTERILAHERQDYLQEVIDQRWPRMGVRAGLLALFLFSLQLVGLKRRSEAGALPVLGLALRVPYLSGEYGRRALALDIVVPLVAAALMAWVTWP
jgi:hypothetical protein